MTDQALRRACTAAPVSSIAMTSSIQRLSIGVGTAAEGPPPGDTATTAWDVHGGGCADRTNDGWTLLRGLPSGTVNVTQSLGGTPCPES